MHARTKYLRVLSHDGEVFLEQNLRRDPSLFLRAIEPQWEDLIVAVERLFTSRMPPWFLLGALPLPEPGAD